MNRHDLHHDPDLHHRDLRPHPIPPPSTVLAPPRGRKTSVHPVLLRLRLMSFDDPNVLAGLAGDGLPFFCTAVLEGMSHEGMKAG
ncbi:hypothetical protein B0H19DRAFT_83540 [Mycena capillaripes]|nr:hypothetical protein B0H19DRAFT_83540 [Mycena capillaripes]